MISVFTPLSKAGNPYVAETWQSLLAQTHSDWEWIVMPNNGGEVPDTQGDRRVRVLFAGSEKGVGALKRRCCEAAQGEVVVELDHDDVLAPNALEKIHAAARDGAGFVFSDFLNFGVDEHGKYSDQVFGTQYGWSSYEVEFRGTRLRALVAPDATPQNMRRIEWAPNHVRAWTREAYAKAGGHDPSLEVADDHDLVLRTYLSGAKMVRVPECLYFYRLHAEQTSNWKHRNQQIQELDWRVYEHRIEDVAKKFASDSNLLAIDLCGGIDTRDGFVPLDKTLGHNLNERWPLGDSSVGVIRAQDAIEHLHSHVHTMNEAWRLLAPGGFLLTSTPSTDGRGAFQDPTHVSFWNENSFWYYTRREQARYVPEIQARFQVSRVRTHFPTEWHAQHNIPYVEAHLIALKDGYQPMGEVLI